MGWVKDVGSWCANLLLLYYYYYCYSFRWRDVCVPTIRSPSLESIILFFTRAGGFFVLNPLSGVQCVHVFSFSGSLYVKLTKTLATFLVLAIYKNCVGVLQGTSLIVIIILRFLSCGNDRVRFSFKGKLLQEPFTPVVLLPLYIIL